MHKKLFIKVDNQKLKGTIFYPKKIKNKNPAILFIHGWTSNETGYVPRAKALCSLGFICLTFNLRGHNGEQKDLDKFSRRDHLEDSLAAYNFLSSLREIDKNQIGVVGASYGAYLASILSSKKKLKWLALRAPALFKNKEFDMPTQEVVSKREEDFFQEMIPKKNNFALKGIKNFKGKLLLIESENDEIIPNKIIKYYLNSKKNASHSIIRKADHALLKDKWRREFIEILVKWFKERS